MALTVSKLAARVGLTTDTIRYYERTGLIPRRIGPYPVTAPSTTMLLRDCGSSRALNALAFVSRRSRSFSTSRIGVSVRAVTPRTF